MIQLAEESSTTANATKSETTMPLMAVFMQTSR